METCFNISTLEMLPDEILLEVCKYLLCNDILQSFFGLNCRMTQMITQYPHHVSLYKTSISKFDYLRTNVLPQIGSQIRSLFIDCCYSVLQDELFFEHFGEKMFMIFPQLERISIIAYQHEQLLALLTNLSGLDHLIEIRLYSLFPIELLHQPTVVQSLFQANNQRLNTILIDDKSSSLSFDNTNCFLNILQLRINLKTLADLNSVFAAVPNVRYLDVLIRERVILFESMKEMKLSSLSHLTDFRLKCINHMWKLEELLTLFIQLPTVRHLSLFLSTLDVHLTNGSLILSSLPSTVQQFNYAVDYFSNITLNQDETIVNYWPPSHPVSCYLNDRFLFLHTLPWDFPRIEVRSLLGKMISCHTNGATGYERQVEQLDLEVNKNFTFSKSLTVISQCRRVREITIHVRNYDDAVKEDKPPISRLSKLSQLVQISFYGPMPSDLNHLSFILNAAPNLFRLDLPFNYLLKLFEDQQICHLLDRRITTLSVESISDLSSPTLSEEHISIIASTFSRLSGLHVNLEHLPCSTATVSKENIVDDSLVENASVQSCEQKYEVVQPFSSEWMLLYLLTRFKEHRLIGLCVDGKFLEEIKTDAQQWLRNNSILCELQFKAVYNKEMDQLLIWM